MYAYRNEKNRPENLRVKSVAVRDEKTNFTSPESVFLQVFLTRSFFFFYVISSAFLCVHVVSGGDNYDERTDGGKTKKTERNTCVSFGSFPRTQYIYIYIYNRYYK